MESRAELATLILGILIVGGVLYSAFPSLFNPTTESVKNIRPIGGPESQTAPKKEIRVMEDIPDLHEHATLEPIYSPDPVAE